MLNGGKGPDPTWDDERVDEYLGEARKALRSADATIWVTLGDFEEEMIP